MRAGGVLLFDCWYGPGVLPARPEVRAKRFEDDKISVLRVAEPVMYPNQNLVDVNYTMLIRDKGTNTVEELRETHRMRYFFTPRWRCSRSRAVSSCLTRRNG